MYTAANTDAEVLAFLAHGQRFRTRSITYRIEGTHNRGWALFLGGYILLCVGASRDYRLAIRHKPPSRPQPLSAESICFRTTNSSVDSIPASLYKVALALHSAPLDADLFSTERQVLIPHPRKTRNTH